jgi:hypothetical protein
MLKAKPVEFNLDNLRYVSERLGDIPYFIFYGTLLGYVREGSIIVGDDDIDLFVEDRYKAEIFDVFQGSELQMRRRQKRFQTPHFAQGLRRFEDEPTFVDFYLYENNEDAAFIIDRWNFAGQWRNRETDVHIPKSLIYPCRPATMQGIPITIPANPEACCEFLYGPDWKTPRAKKTEYKTVIKGNRPTVVLVSGPIDFGIGT